MFEKPYFFWLLLLVPLIALFLVFDIFQIKKRALKLSGKNLSLILPYYSEGQKWIKTVIYILAFILAVIALARPKWGTTLTEYKVKGRDILILLDVSNSMSTNDLIPSRFELSKKNIEVLLESESTDRIGLMAFSDKCELLSPMTNDYAAIMLFLDTISPGSLGRGGTNIGSAIVNAIQAFDDDEEMSSKMILLITDGENLQGNISRYLARAKERNIRIFTAGVGTPNGKPIPIKNSNGETEGFIKGQDGKIIVSKLDSKLLKIISKETNAFFLGVINNKNFLANAVSQIKSVEKREQQKVSYENKKDRYDLFLIPALILFCVGFILEQGKVLKIKNNRFDWIINKKFILLAFLTFVSYGSMNIYSQNVQDQNSGLKETKKLIGKPNGGFWGNIDFKKGNYSKALENYFSAINYLKKESLSKLYYNIGNVFYKTSDSRRSEKYYIDAEAHAKDEKYKSSIYYNHGLLAFKNGNYEAAKAFFKKAIESNQEDDDARYNYTVSDILNKEAKKNNSDKSDDNRNEQKQENKNSASDGRNKINKSDMNNLLEALDDKEKENNKLKQKNRQGNKEGVLW